MEDIGLSINYLDLIIAIPLLWFGYKGFKNGFVVEAASLAALLLGVYGAFRFSGITADFLTNTMGMTSEYMRIISFAITFLIIVILVHLLAKMINKLVKAVALGFVNKLIGLIFGVAKIAFILSILLGIFNKLDSQQKMITPIMKNESLLYKPLSSFAPAIFPYLNMDDIKINMDNPAEKVIENV